MVRACLQLTGRDASQKQPCRIDLVSKKKGSLLLDVVVVDVSQPHLLSNSLKVVHLMSKTRDRGASIQPY